MKFLFNGKPEATAAARADASGLPLNEWNRSP
jgi:hypothetical protein